MVKSRKVTTRKYAHFHQVDLRKSEIKIKNSIARGYYRWYQVLLHMRVTELGFYQILKYNSKNDTRNGN